MAFKYPYMVKAERIVHLEVPITSDRERAVLDYIRRGVLNTETTPEEYETLGDEERAEFIAAVIVSNHMDFARPMGETFHFTDVYVDESIAN